MQRGVMHVSQLATWLDLPAPEIAASVGLAFDLTAVLEAWIAEVRALPFDLLVAPTPSRGRSLRNLTVNVFHPIELLTRAWETGSFPWSTLEDEEREQLLTDARAVVDFAEAIEAEWREFLLGADETLAVQDPVVETLRGGLRYSELLDAQRWHAAFHHRQLIDFVEREGRAPVDSFRADRLPGLELPADVY